MSYQVLSGGLVVLVAPVNKPLLPNQSIRIFGVDPGSRIAGFGVVDCLGEKVTHLQHGIISLTDEPSFAARLLGLSQSLQSLLLKHQPDWVVIEKLFLGKNPHSAFQLGHARGVVLVEAQRYGAQLAEYTPRAIKKTMTGLGAADKQAVALALKRLLKIETITHLDASDALALAWHQSQVLLEQQRLKRGI